MNFLEELAAEWYEYKGYFVRRNIKFGRRSRGGYKGEMDVVAFNPQIKEFIHIETSTDAFSWKERKKIFQRKFKNAEEFYDKLFSFGKKRIKKLAICGFARPNIKPDFGDNIHILFIPEFIQKITAELKDRNPLREAVPENYPLLRAIQYSSFYGK
jgi:Holliday junction resolvase-like predicted endonuclease